jgi:hypothetical protein
MPTPSHARIAIRVFTRLMCVGGDAKSSLEGDSKSSPYVSLGLGEKSPYEGKQMIL